MVAGTDEECIDVIWRDWCSGNEAIDPAMGQSGTASAAPGLVLRLPFEPRSVICDVHCFLTGRPTYPIAFTCVPSREHQ